MKKLFLLIPALVLSLMVKAADQYPDPAVDNSLATAVSAVGDNEVIYLDEGTYTNSAASDYTKIRSGKHITFKAIDGKNPVVQLKYPFQIREASTAKFEGIKFDGTSLAYDSYFLLYDATDNTWEFKDCEFTALSKYIIYVATDKKAASIVFDSCYFYDITKSCVLVENTGESNLTVKNSTFANIDATGVSAGVVDSRTATGVVTVDHCTFYNCRVKNTDYGTVRVASPNATVSNCIFAMPSSTNNLRTVYLPSGLPAGTTVTHCLMHNYLYDSNIGIPSRTGLNKIECNAGDPLFNDLANNKYIYDGNWVTMSISPARGAATDGSDLGDPRWYSAETLPEVDFATPYQFVGAKAVLNGKIWYDQVNEYLYGEGGSNKNYGTATWKFHATKGGVFSIAANINSGNTSTHNLRVEVLDADGNSVGEFAEQTSTLPGTLVLPAVGDYKVILHDDQEWASTKIDNVTISYIGGDVQAMPGTTNINDAWFSANGTRANGKISFPGSTIQEGWVKWNVSFANTGNYNVTLNVNSNNCKNYTVALVDANDANVVTPLTLNDCSTKGTPVALAMGAMEVPAGNYILKVTNATQNSDAELISVQFAYTGGGIIDIPGSIALNEAILSERAFVDGDGLHFVDADHLWLMSEGYAKWNIHVAADGIYKFTANCNTYETSWSNLTIQILQGGEEKYTYTPEYTYSGEKEIKSPEWFLEAGNYELKLSNPRNHSNGYLVSLSAAAVEGILIVDEMATDMAYINELNGQSRKPLLKRTFKGGMYNTVCFPFNNVTDADLVNLFGEGYELLELSSATLNGTELNLIFANVDLSADTYGRPYLIKPTQDVENPLFNSHTIYKSTSHLTKECDAANFIGSFIAGEVPAGDQNLFLGPNDLLYFSQNATPIKGMRAYFHVKVPGAANNVKAARIVKGTQVITEINLVGADSKAIKTIENGQLIFTIDGVRYNVMGTKIQ